MASKKIKIQYGIVVALAVCAVAIATTKPSPPRRNVQSESDQFSGFRPRKEIKDVRFVGNVVCANCHNSISKSQQATAMGKALEFPSNCRILDSNKELRFQSGPYQYRIERRKDQSIYSVTNGGETFSEPILFCFGQGKAGQTYVFKHDGSFYESRLSYYIDIAGLDYTIGYAREAPPTIVEAAGRAISADEAQNCFSCHSTGAVRNNLLNLDHLRPGVGCEACHGPGEKHVLEMKSQKPDSTFILNPAKLDTDEFAQEFCGACHRSVEDVSRMPQLGGGINNVRFQPYRLFNSPGHNPTDDRLRCSTCHEVHKDLKHDSAYYDARCFACHQSGKAASGASIDTVATSGQTAKACPKASKDCVSCHMPQFEIPGSHFRFTDHRIRIVRPGDKYPT